MSRVIRFLLLLLLPLTAAGQKVALPLKPDSVRFAVIGDNGTGAAGQYDVARMMTTWRAQFPFEFVIMNGDNIYGTETPRDFQTKFEIPYKPLLDAGVKFYAVLGNHDDSNERYYKAFNMNGERYYTFRQKNVSFFALDSNYMSRPQLDWIEQQLRNASSGWKICFFHHPLYSSGRAHGPATDLRAALEPLFVKYGVNVVFSGHEHFYERIKPQNGIHYFICGAAGQLRKRNIMSSGITDKGFDQDNSFMLVEIAGDELYFESVSRTGEVIDAGLIPKGSENKSSEP